MTSLLSLPNELLLSIASLSPPPELFHIALTSHRLYDIATPALHAYASLDVGGISALEWGSRRGHLGLLKLLFSKGVDINPPHSRALHFAVLYNHEEVIRFLVGHGAEINVQDSEEKTPLHWAVELPWIGIFKVLLELGADWRVVDKMNGDTPLHTAAVDGNIGAVELLLEYGGECLFTKNKRDETPLHRAVHAGKTNVARLFILEKGADVNARDDGGRTPLHLAVCSWNGSLELVELLVNNGADVNAVDLAGRTPLHIAAKFGVKVEVFRFLLGAGVHIYKRTLVGDTAMRLAMMEGHTRHCELINNAMWGI